MEEARQLIEENDVDLKKREDELIQKVNQKSDVKPFTRVRRGRMERVKGYARVGARKAVMFGLMAVMATVFGVSPLMAQTKFGGSYWNLESSQVTGEGTKAKPFTIQQSEKGKAPQGVMSREAFRKVVHKGMTLQQVIQAVGKPDSTSGTGRSLHFEYPHKTMDTITGKVDYMTSVSFWDGVVDSVGFI